MMFLRNIALLSCVFLLSSPFSVFAQQSIKSIIYRLIDLITAALPVLMALAFLYFLWGGARVILSAGDEKSRASGKATLLWGGIALFVMVTVWGLVSIIVGTFFL